MATVLPYHVCKDMVHVKHRRGDRCVDAFFTLAGQIDARVAATREHASAVQPSIFALVLSGRFISPKVELARQAGREYDRHRFSLSVSVLRRRSWGKEGFSLS